MSLNVPTRRNEKLRALVAAIDGSAELGQWWKCANVNAVDRQGMTDHGEVHIRIVANAGLKLLRLLADAGVPATISLIHQTALSTGDYVEVFITNNTGTTSLVVTDISLRIR